MKPSHMRGAVPSTRKYKLKPSPAGHDLFARAVSSKAMLAGPKAPVTNPSLEQWFPGIQDQGQEGACTGFSEAQFIEVLWGSSNQKMIDARRSPGFPYALARMAEGTWPQDNGADLADGFTVLEQYGCCSAADMPYDQDPAEDVPNVAYADAQPFRISTPASVDTSDPQNVLDCLNAGMPVSIAIPVYQSFEDVGGDGVLPIPRPDVEGLLGGHGLLIIAGDSSTALYKVVNQWGASWGKDGFCFMPFGYPMWEAWTAPKFTAVQ